MSAAAELELLITQKGGDAAYAEYKRLVTVNQELTRVVEEQNKSGKNQNETHEVSFRTQQRLASSFVSLGGSLGPVERLWHTYEYAEHMAEQRHMSMTALMANVAPMIGIGLAIGAITHKWEDATKAAEEYNTLTAEFGASTKATAADVLFGDLESKLAALKELKTVFAEVEALAKPLSSEQRQRGAAGPEEAQIAALEQKIKANSDVLSSANPINLVPGVLASDMEKLAQWRSEINQLRANLQERGIRGEAGHEREESVATQNAKLAQEAEKAQAGILKAAAESQVLHLDHFDRASEAFLRRLPEMRTAVEEHAKAIEQIQIDLAHKRAALAEANAPDRGILEGQISGEEADLKGLQGRNPLDRFKNEIAIELIPQLEADKVQQLGETAAQNFKRGFATEKDLFAMQYVDAHGQLTAAARKIGLTTKEDIEQQVAADAASYDKALALADDLQRKIDEGQHKSREAKLGVGADTSSYENVKLMYQAAHEVTHQPNERLVAALNALREQLAKTSLRTAGAPVYGPAMPPILPPPLDFLHKPEGY